MANTLPSLLKCCTTSSTQPSIVLVPDNIIAAILAAKIFKQLIGVWAESRIAIRDFGKENVTPWPLNTSMLESTIKTKS